MAEFSISSGLVFRTLGELVSSDESIRAYFRRKGEYGVEAQLPEILRQLKAVWDAVPQTVQADWADNVIFYRNIFERFDFTGSTPTLKDIPISVVHDLLEELSPVAAFGVNR